MLARAAFVANGGRPRPQAAARGCHRGLRKEWTCQFLDLLLVKDKLAPSSLKVPIAHKIAQPDRKNS